MERGEAILLREFRRELGGGDHRLLVCVRLRNDDLRWSTGFGTLQQASVFHDKVHYRGVHFDILRTAFRRHRRKIYGG